MRLMTFNKFISKEKMKWKETKFKEILPIDGQAGCRWGVLNILGKP